MLRVRKMDMLPFYGFNYYTTYKDGTLVDERYVYELDTLGYKLTLAFVSVETSPKLVIKNYSKNQDFIETVFPQLIKDGVVEYKKEGEEHV